MDRSRDPVPRMTQEEPAMFIRHGLVSAAALCLLSSPLFAGWSLTQVATQSGEGGSGEAKVTQRIWLDGNAAKIELQGIDNPMMEPGSYILALNGGSKVFLVNPARKTYARFDLAAMAESAQAITGSGGGMRIEDPKVVKLLEEPGPEMLGYATTHYRFRTTYTLVSDMTGMKMKTMSDALEDVWTAPAIVVGIGNTLGSLGGGSGTHHELLELERQAKSSMAGIPLKQVTVTKNKVDTSEGGMLGRMMAGRMGGPQSSQATVVVQEIRQTDVPASTFQIPAGFSETEMMQRGPAMPDLGNGR
jgi:hypothetical protein